MSVTRVIHCDGPGCEAAKREKNHWFVTVEGRLFQVHPEPGFAQEAHGSDTIADVCGEVCAVKRLQAWLAGKLAEVAE